MRTPTRMLIALGAAYLLEIIWWLFWGWSAIMVVVACVVTILVMLFTAPGNPPPTKPGNTS